MWRRWKFGAISIGEPSASWKEPGGGPFLAYNSDGTISLQILESSQIDMDDPEKKEMFEKGTHFNPVDLGKGVSQGHSDAVRRIEGVKDARQYTIPVESALERVRSGENPALTTREKHTRECFVVAEKGADRAKIEEAIKTMPNYFADYDTTVHFISEEEMRKNHSGIPHGGRVFRCVIIAHITDKTSFPRQGPAKESRMASQLRCFTKPLLSKKSAW